MNPTADGGIGSILSVQIDWRCGTAVPTCRMREGEQGVQHGCHRRGSFGGWAEEVGAVAVVAPWSEMSEDK